jgi:MoaA/NifB/PqqE/SkfB family radical SAM enzyme
LEVTRRCNLPCRHCFVPRENQEPGLDVLIPLLLQASLNGCRKVLLTGGEPLLRPDLEAIISACAGTDMLVDLNSNLITLDEQRARRLQEAGLGEVSVSLHGDRTSHDWLCGRTGCYDRTLQAIKILLGLGIPVDVHGALWEGSLPALPELVHLCENLGVASLTLFQIIPVEHGHSAADEYSLSRVEAWEQITDLRAQVNLPIRTIGLCPPDPAECVMGTSLFGIDASLHLSPCLLADNPQGGIPIQEEGFAAAMKKLETRLAQHAWSPACMPMEGDTDGCPQ